MKTLLDRAELVIATNGKLSAWTIGSLTRQKQIPHIVIGKRRYLYSLEDVERWLDNLQITSMQQAK